MDGRFVSLFDSSSFCSILFYNVLFLLYRSMANLWNLYSAIGARECLPPLSTYLVEEGKLSHQIAQSVRVLQREAIYKSYGSSRLLTQSTIGVFWPSWYGLAF